MDLKNKIQMFIYFENDLNLGIIMNKTKMLTRPNQWKHKNPIDVE